MPYSASAQSGSALGIRTTISEVGDFNGDGINDFVVGSPYGAGALDGRAFIIYGDADGLPRDLDLDALDPSDGVEIMGAEGGTLFQTGDLLGYDVRDAGDINGDGFDDVVIGAPQTDNIVTSTYSRYTTYFYTNTYTYTVTNTYTNFNTYSVYVPAYSTYSYYTTYSGGVITYTNYFPGFTTYYSDPTYYTVTNTYTGRSYYSNYVNVTNTYTSSYQNSGTAYVIYGTNAAPASVDVSALGGDGTALIGRSFNDLLGMQVTGVGDFNGDGIDDVAASGVYAYYGSPGVFVLFGDSGGLPDETLASDLVPNGTGMMLTDGGRFGSGFGHALDGGQDINGDGFGDVVVGAPGAYAYSTYTYTVVRTYTDFFSTYVVTYTGTGFYTTYTTYGEPSYVTYTFQRGNFVTYSNTYQNTYTYTGYNYVGQAGRAYVFFGDSSASSISNASFSLNGSNGFIFNGASPGDAAGYDVALVGDANGDGIDDVLIGAPGAYSGEGEAYLVFGSTTPFDLNLNKFDLNGSTGVVITGDGNGAGLGQTVGGVGDVNGDGFDDFAVVDTDALTGTNWVHVFFGTSAPLPSGLSIADLDGSNGFSVEGFAGLQNFGQSVAGADVNGDGLSDVMATVNNASFVMQGDAETRDFIDALDGASDGILSAAFFADPYLIGTGSDDVLMGTFGTPTLAFGLDGNDDIMTSIGDDEIDGGLGDDTIASGAGADTVQGGRGDDNVSGGTGDDLIRTGGGADEVRGGRGDDVVNANQGEDEVFGQRGHDTITGGGGDDLLDGGKDDDLVRGGNGNDTILGDEGDDRLQGNFGRDLMNGGTGDDNMSGGNGLDTLIGGEGDDLLRGEGQSDMFVFVDGFGHDTVLDFDALDNNEQIDLSGVSGLTNYVDLFSNHLTQVGSDVVFDDLMGNTIELTNVLLSDLDRNDFIL